MLGVLSNMVSARPRGHLRRLDCPIKGSFNFILCVIFLLTIDAKQAQWVHNTRILYLLQSSYIQSGVIGNSVNLILLNLLYSSNYFPWSCGQMTVVELMASLSALSFAVTQMLYILPSLSLPSRQASSWMGG